MDIHNTESLKKAKSTKPENHPATINVSDPCIDVCYLLCVDVKMPFWEDPLLKEHLLKEIVLKKSLFKNFTS